MRKLLFIAILAAGGLGAAIPLAAQAPRGPDAAARPPAAAAYPSRVTDPAAVARGKTLFATNNCSFCHGADIRGGDGGGPNLLPSQKVLNDQHGEILGPFLHTGAPGTAMPAFPNLTAAEVADIAEFLHSFGLNSRDPARALPLSIVTGDASAGEAYFKATCSGCHNPTGDLRGLAVKYKDPRDLQQAYLSPPGPPHPNTVVVTLASGARSEGRLVTIDEFLVSFVPADGRQRTIPRRGDTPKVEVRDPLGPHKALLVKYTDKNIHDLTAYLVGLK
jgi:cytochrome c oxidase cbb3-type subunit 3